MGIILVLFAGGKLNERVVENQHRIQGDEEETMEKTNNNTKDCKNLYQTL